MSKVTKRWLSEDLQNQLTGMVSDINDLEAGLTGARKDIAGLTGAVRDLEIGLTGAKRDIAGLTGAVSSLETRVTGAINTFGRDIAGLTGAVSSLEMRVTGAINSFEVGLTGANNYLAGLTGSVSNLATYIYNIQAVNVGFTPITGAGSTNVQGAIAALVQYVNAAVTGVNYGSGVTGAMGFTGAMGVTGYGGVIAHNQLTNMPDISGIVTDHDVRLVPKVQNDAPAIPTPFTGMLWLDMDAVESMGVTGPGGLPGFTGLQGVTGLEGPITGLQGPRGTTGLQGPRGLQGIQGPRGLQGIQGLTGAEGPITGLPGPMGATGLDGVTGLNGLDGVTGSQGATGVNPQETSNIAFDTLTISANTITLDLSTNSTFSVTLTSNVTTVNITNITSGKLNFFTLFVSQDGAGGKTFTTPVNWRYPGGTAYVVSSTASARDLVQGMSFDNGTTWLVTYAKAFA